MHLLCAQPHVTLCGPCPGDFAISGGSTSEDPTGNNMDREGVWRSERAQGLHMRGGCPWLSATGKQDTNQDRPGPSMGASVGDHPLYD